LLNGAGVKFVSRDFSNISIAHAVLSNSIFVNTSLKNSDLSKVDFINSYFYNVNFDEANMANLKWGTYPPIDLSREGPAGSVHKNHTFRGGNLKVVSIYTSVTDNKIKVRRQNEDGISCIILVDSVANERDRIPDLEDPDMIFLTVPTQTYRKFATINMAEAHNLVLWGMPAWSSLEDDCKCAPKRLQWTPHSDHKSHLLRPDSKYATAIYSYNQQESHFA
jgi:hypothetical protein